MYKKNNAISAMALLSTPSLPPATAEFCRLVSPVKEIHRQWNSALKEKRFFFHAEFGCKEKMTTFLTE
jgi:hypothetical protein